MAYETEVANVENYYANLLILQYRNKPKARATIKLGTDVYLADGLVFELNDCLNIDTAYGAQLDLIGKILGVNRILYGFSTDKPFFSFEKSDAYGYSDKTELSQGYWKNYKLSIGSEYSLVDNDYRSLLKFKAAYNLRRASMADLDLLYFNLFGNEIEIINNQDLSITYKVSNNLSTALRAAIYLGYIEAPLGISYTIQYI